MQTLIHTSQFPAPIYWLSDIVPWAGLMQGRNRAEMPILTLAEHMQIDMLPTLIGFLGKRVIINHHFCYAVTVRLFSNYNALKSKL